MCYARVCVCVCVDILPEKNNESTRVLHVAARRLLAVVACQLPEELVQVGLHILGDAHQVLGQVDGVSSKITRETKSTSERS